MGERRGRYPAELRAPAVRLVAESRSGYDSEWAAIDSVAAVAGAGALGELAAPGVVVAVAGLASLAATAALRHQLAPSSQREVAAGR